MSCEYFGLDWMKNKITAIHCSSDNKRIICGYETGTMAIWEIERLEGYNPNEEAKDRAPTRRNSNVNAIRPQRDPRKFYKLNLKSCQSSSYSSGYEIIAIDANPDLGMFVAVNKHLVATVHSLKTGECLNWIRFLIDSRSFQGVQLSKNGYFVLASCVRSPKQNPVTQKLENNRCTSFQTFGINGECITPEPFYVSSVIQAAIMNERLYSTIGSSQNSENNLMSNKTDDKIFFFDRSRAFCMNCIDFELTEFDYDLNKKKYKFLAHWFNSKKGWVMISKTTNKDNEDYEILEPLSDKWDQLKKKLIM